MVADFYDEIALDFHRTRRALWPGVVKFLKGLGSGSRILDVGCGNGKYLSLRAADCEVHGCDRCKALVEIAGANHPGACVVYGDGLEGLPYADESFDAVMSIAVVHHLETVDDRMKFIREMMRVLKPGGMMLVSVWALEARKDSWVDAGGGDFMVPWADKCMRMYHLFSKEEAIGLVDDDDDGTIEFEANNWYVSYKKIKK